MCGEADGWMEYGVNHDAAPGVIRAGGGLVASLQITNATARCLTVAGLGKAPVRLRAGVTFLRQYAGGG